MKTCNTCDSRFFFFFPFVFKHLCKMGTPTLENDTMGTNIFTFHGKYNVRVILDTNRIITKDY